MSDLATLGLSVDSSQVEAANKSLNTFAQSGKNAQVSADVLVASAVRLGITVEEVQRRLAAANDNMKTNAELAIKLADATKQAAASNDNLAGSMKTASAATSDANRGFFTTIEHVLNLTGHLKLLALAAYALSPAFRGIVNSGIRTFLLDILPITGLTQKAFENLSVATNSLLTFFARIGPPILTAVVALKAIEAVWEKGSALLEKYANSLRSLYSEDTIQNLQKLTKGQGEAGDVISAEQIARATELGVRLQDASFIINKFLTTSIIDLTNASLRLQSVWVKFVELVARGAQILSTIPVAKLAQAGLSGIPMLGQVAGPGIKLASSVFSSEDPNQDAVKAATDRLSAMMGVQNLAKESTEKLGKSIIEIDKEFDIGQSFIAKYSDALKKLANGANDTESWDRVAKAIERQTTRLEANAASAGKSVEFQERLRVETQLLATAVTDKQLDAFTDLRVQGFSPMEAALTAGINLIPKYAEQLEKLGKNAGVAKSDIEQANFALANTKALAADAIASKALTAFSPAAKGDIAEQQKRLELEVELRRVKGDALKTAEVQEMIDERAANARQNAIKAELVQMQEARRSRELSAKQSVDSSRLEVELIGKSIGQQTELRANLQARQQLEQEASQKRTKFDEKQYEDLKKINEELGKQAQLNAIANLRADIKFGAKTSLLTPEDVAIASQLRNIYPDVATALNSVEASGLQANKALSGLSSTMSSTLTTGLADIFDGTKSVQQGFSDMGKVVVRALEEMIIKLYIIIPLMRALQASMSSLGFFGAGAPASGAVNNPTQIGSWYHSGGIVGQEPTAMRAVNDNVFFGAPRFHKGLMPDEFPAILQRGEGVFTKGQMAAMGGGTQVTVNLVEDSSRAGQTEQKTNQNGGLDLTVFVDSITARNASNPGSATSMALDTRKRVASR